MAVDYTKYLKPIKSRMFNCSFCGKSLKETDLVIDCADCGAIFCEDCVRNGEIEAHECEEDFEDDED